MALNIAALKPKKTTMPARRGTNKGRDLGPNIFLDRTWEWNLQASYDNAEPYEITVAGTTKEDTIKKGERKGQKTTRVTGDAADAVTLLRNAATKLGIGVTIDVVPAAAKGQMIVKYQGQKRKAARKPKAATPAVVTGAPAVQ